MRARFDSDAPGGALAPFVAGQDGPFDAELAAHLLRRTGFGAPDDEIAALLALGFEAAVDRLVDARPDNAAIAELDRSASAIASGEIDGLQSWWVARMLRTDDPLREKLALFWHGHFATSNDRVNDTRLMHGQLRTFLDLGRGPFAKLLAAVSVDPAMLVWLDGEKNKKAHPNENFARELFELFTLGVGNYTEHDIREAARALTGYRRAGGRFEFVPARHDGTDKTIFGKTGRFAPQDVLDLALANDAAPRFIAYKLARFFGDPEPDAAVVEALAALARENSFEIGELLRALFKSRWFCAKERRAAHVQSPVEFVVGPLRMLGHAGARINATLAAKAIGRAGQDLLRPPNVKGWDGERAFVHAGALLSRLSFAARFSKDDFDGLARSTEEALDRLFPALAADGDAARIAARARELVLRRPLDAAAEQAVAAAVAAAGGDRRAHALMAVQSLPEASLG